MAGYQETLSYLNEVALSAKIVLKAIQNQKSPSQDDVLNVIEFLSRDHEDQKELFDELKTGFNPASRVGFHRQIMMNALKAIGSSYFEKLVREKGSQSGLNERSRQSLIAKTRRDLGYRNPNLTPEDRKSRAAKILN